MVNSLSSVRSYCAVPGLPPVVLTKTAQPGQPTAHVYCMVSLPALFGDLKSLSSILFSVSSRPGNI